MRKRTQEDATNFATAVHELALTGYEQRGSARRRYDAIYVYLLDVLGPDEFEALREDYDMTTQQDEPMAGGDGPESLRRIFGGL